MSCQVGLPLSVRTGFLRSPTSLWSMISKPFTREMFMITIIRALALYFSMLSSGDVTICQVKLGRPSICVCLETESVLSVTDLSDNNTMSHCHISYVSFFAR